MTVGHRLICYVDCISKLSYVLGVVDTSSLLQLLQVYCCILLYCEYGVVKVLIHYLGKHSPQIIWVNIALPSEIQTCSSGTLLLCVCVCVQT